MGMISSCMIMSLRVTGAKALNFQSTFETVTTYSVKSIVVNVIIVSLSSSLLQFADRVIGVKLSFSPSFVSSHLPFYFSSSAFICFLVSSHYVFMYNSLDNKLTNM